MYYKPNFAHFITWYRTQLKSSVTYTPTEWNNEDTCRFTTQTLIDRPAILTPVWSQLAYLFNVWTRVKGCYVYLVQCLNSDLYSMGTFFKTDIFISAPGIPDSIKILKLRASFADHSPSSRPKIKKFLPPVMEIWVRRKKTNYQIPYWWSVLMIL